LSKVKPTLVRLDSGDRFSLSQQVRKILDRAGLNKTKIFVSGDLNEYILNEFTSRGAPMDQFGVGTELVTSRDDPALSGIYKLVALEREGKEVYRAKTSEGKRTIPGVKQIHRRLSSTGEIVEDILALEDEEAPVNTIPLLTKVMDKGQLVYSLPKLNVIQERAKEQLKTLPAKFKELTGSEGAPVKLSRRLEELTNSLWNSHSAGVGKV
jgi:nicotinate phosphoribosyltransferase